jgi:hypothetical protein
VYNKGLTHKHCARLWAVKHICINLLDGLGSLVLPCGEKLLGVRVLLDGQV